MIVHLLLPYSNMLIALYSLFEQKKVILLRNYYFHYYIPVFFGKETRTRLNTIQSYDKLKNGLKLSQLIQNWVWKGSDSALLKGEKVSFFEDGSNAITIVGAHSKPCNPSYLEASLSIGVLQEICRGLLKSALCTWSIVLSILGEGLTLVAVWSKVLFVCLFEWFPSRRKEIGNPSIKDFSSHPGNRTNNPSS